MILTYDRFTLAYFEGALDFLLHLIQKDEINIHDIPIQELMRQFNQKLIEEQNDRLDKGAEFIGVIAYLVWLKSQSLLPREIPPETEAAIEDPQFEVIRHLIDYCRFKQVTKELLLRQEKEGACYFRGAETFDKQKPMGIHHLSLDELAGLFKNIMANRPQTMIHIQEEEWQVGDKIRWIRESLDKQERIPLIFFLSSEKSRLELIVTFLAILELMKIGELIVGQDIHSSSLSLFVKRKEG
jgi:segregation and condensation protein A